MPDHPPYPAGSNDPPTQWVVPPVSPPNPYQWVPSGYRPEPQQTPQKPATSRRGGIVGLLTALGAAALKYGFLVLKLFKFSTLFSALITYGFMVTIYGWQFALGLLLLVLIHEFGHMVAATREGVPVTAPIFAIFGAFVRTSGGRTDSRQDAVISVAGPVAGMVGVGVCFALAQLSTSAHGRGLFYALASFGSLITLLNLLPVGPLDGAKVARAMSPVGNLVATVILAAIFLISDSGILILFALVSGYVTFHRFRSHRPPSPLTPASPRAQIGIAIAYCSTLAIAGIALTIANTAAIANGVHGR